MDRRRLLRSVPAVVVASSLPSLWNPASAAKTRLGAAMLVPQTGRYAALGRSMARAVAVAQGASRAPGRDEDHDGPIRVYDSGETPASAAAAARAARKGGASIIFGPVFAREVPAVLAAVGRDVPVVSFSNDAGLIESGAFLLGLTARQSIAAILGYAAGRGVRRVAIAGPAEGWNAQARTAAAALAATIGIAIVQLPAATGGVGDDLPDAVLATDAATLAGLAPALTAQGMQPLGAFQGLDMAPDVLVRIEGAWIAGPDPAAFAGFAHAFEQRNGTAPGALAALAYDAAGIAVQLLRSGGTDRSALLAVSGFRAITGTIRFHEDGSAARALAILEVAQGRLRTVATQAG